MDDLNDDFNGPARIRIISQAKREMRKNKRVRAIFMVKVLREKNHEDCYYYRFQILLENRELRHSLAEHQTVLEMVMNKFRRVSTHAANLERSQTITESQNGVIELKVILKRFSQAVLK